MIFEVQKNYSNHATSSGVQHHASASADEQLEWTRADEHHEPTSETDHQMTELDRYSRTCLSEYCFSA